MAAVFGGVGLKVLEVFTSRKTRDLDESRAIRDELRHEIVSLKTEVLNDRSRNDQLEEDLAELRGNHYILMERVLFSYQDADDRKALIEDVRNNLHNKNVQ